jgi:hypothetical protein
MELVFILIHPNKVWTLICAISHTLMWWVLLKEGLNMWQEGRDDGDGRYAHLRHLGGCAACSMVWPLHVPLGSGRAWVEVLKYQYLIDIQTTH